MAQIVRLSETFWLSLEHVVSVQDDQEEGVLTVTLNLRRGNKKIDLEGEERTNLLTLLTRTSAYVNPKHTPYS